MTNQRDRLPSRARATKLALAAIFVLAALARLHGIDELDVWVDEANLILTAQQAPSSLLARLKLDSSPPLFYLIVHGWIGVVGDGSVALRMLSVLTGLGLVASIYWAGRDLISPQAGLWGAFFAAASPIQAFYSQQVRMYCLAAILALLSVAALVRYLRDGSRRDFARWIAFTVLALYTHNFAIHLLPVHAALIVLSGELVRQSRSWLLASAIVALAYAPWLSVLAGQLGNPDHYAWFLFYWKFFGPSGVVENTFLSFSPGAEFLTYADIGDAAVWRGRPALGVLLLAAVGLYAQVAHFRRRGLVLALWPLILLALPILTALAASVVVTPHYVPGRVDQMMFPAFALLVGAGLANLRPTLLRFGAAAAILVIATLTKLDLYPDYQEQPGLQGSERVLAARIAERWAPNDAILCTSLTRAPLEYYLGRAGVTARFISYPRDTAAHLGSQNDARLLSRPKALAREARAVALEARSLIGSEGRLFLIRVPTPVNRLLTDDRVAGPLGFRLVENLGRFKQYGTGNPIDARVYRSREPVPSAPVGSSSSSDSDPRAPAGGSASHRYSTSGALSGGGLMPKRATRKPCFS